MTRKDYRILAAAFHYAIAHDLSAEKTTLHVAQCLQLANPTFQIDKFLSAAK